MVEVQRELATRGGGRCGGSSRSSSHALPTLLHPHSQGSLAGVGRLLFGTDLPGSGLLGDLPCSCVHSSGTQPHACWNPGRTESISQVSPCQVATCPRWAWGCLIHKRVGHGNTWSTGRP